MSSQERLELHLILTQRRRLLRVISATAAATLLAAVAALLLVPAGSAQGAANGEIVFTRHVKGTGAGAIYSVNADGTGLRRLTRGSTSFGAVYSPDGTRIAFSSGRSSSSRAPEVWVMDADRGNARRLTRAQQAPRL